MSDYPEHEKLRAVAEESQAIGEFLDVGPYTLCRLAEFEDSSRVEFVEVDIQDALAEYFGVDRVKLEQEKRAMLNAVRAAAASTEMTEERGS